MTYAVMTPAKTYNGTQIVPTFITDDKESAIKNAREIKAKFERKGWGSWANKVSIKAPMTAKGYWELAEKVSAYGHQVDMASQGNSFYGQDLLNWANTLRIRADEIANPESYAA